MHIKDSIYHSSVSAISSVKGFALFLCFFPLTLSAQQVEYWSPLSKPTQHTLSSVHFIDSTHGWITGQNGVLMHTNNGGIKWTQQISGAVGEIPTIEVRTPNDLWSLEYRYPLDDTSWFGTNIYHSTNAGASWNVQQFDSTIFRTITFLDSLTGFIGGSNGTIAKTTNAGETWRVVHTGSQNDSDKWPMYQISFGTKKLGIAVGGQLDIAGLVWRTTDAGESWKPLKIAGDPIVNVYFFDTLHILCGMADLDASGAGFLRSTDAGETWNFENTMIWGEPTALVFRTPTDLWVPMGIAGFCLRSSNGGITWTEIPNPGQVPSYDISFPTPYTGFMIGHKGALFKFNPNVLSSNSNESTPVSTSLAQNYPNPFNGNTTFSFILAERAHVTLSVYDILGRQIAEVQNGLMESGDHSIRWNAGDLPSGMYLYRLTYKQQFRHGKLIIQR